LRTHINVVNAIRLFGVVINSDLLQKMSTKNLEGYTKQCIGLSDYRANGLTD